MFWRKITIDACFMRVGDRRAFYPVQYFGKGYVLDQVAEQALRRFLRWWTWANYGIFCAAVWLAALTLHYLAAPVAASPALFAFAIAVCVDRVVVMRWLRKYPRTAKRISYAEYIDMKASADPDGKIVGFVLLILFLMMIDLVGLGLAIKNNSHWAIYFSIFLMCCIFILIESFLIVRIESRHFAAANRPADADEPDIAPEGR
jgi:hypothetical protein